MNALVLLEDVTKVYGSQPALDGVSLAIEPGESVAVMGPSGSGKSTLLNLIAGLDLATAGTVRLDDQDVGRLNETRRARLRRRSVGLVFQFFNLLDNLSALDNIAVAAELAGAGRADSVRRADELLDRLGLADKRSAFPSRLSGGERQRVAVARAIVNDPPLLLADEPTGALDSHSGEQVLDLLRELNRGGRTLILVTHDQRLAEACAERHVHLADGRLTADRRLDRAVAL
ncbi:MAG TPA: ABC transporter ATP-binding protein [Candidatus Dormibacteraeota bacterium]